MEVLTTILGAILGYCIARYQTHLSNIKEHNERVDTILYRLERLESDILYPEGSDEQYKEWQDIMAYCEVYFDFIRENFYEYTFDENYSRDEFLGHIRSLKK